jgi:hypothetical protein
MTDGIATNVQLISMKTRAGLCLAFVLRADWSSGYFETQRVHLRDEC